MTGAVRVFYLPEFAQKVEGIFVYYVQFYLLFLLLHFFFFFLFFVREGYSKDYYHSDYETHT